MQKWENKSGMISVEVGFGILFAVVVLLLVLNGVSKQVNKIATLTNLDNVTKSEERTAFTQYNRDYSNSKVILQEHP